MKRSRVAFTLSTILASPLAFFLPLVLSGCGGTEETKEVKFEKPVGEAGKDSMNFYMQNKNQSKRATEEVSFRVVLR